MVPRPREFWDTCTVRARFFNSFGRLRSYQTWSSYSPSGTFFRGHQSADNGQIGHQSGGTDHGDFALLRKSLVGRSRMVLNKRVRLLLAGFQNDALRRARAEVHPLTKT
jgi:hypothetical protein